MGANTLSVMFGSGGGGDRREEAPGEGERFGTRG